MNNFSDCNCVILDLNICRNGRKIQTPFLSCVSDQIFRLSWKFCCQNRNYIQKFCEWALFQQINSSYSPGKNAKKDIYIWLTGFISAYRCTLLCQVYWRTFLKKNLFSIKHIAKRVFSWKLKLHCTILFQGKPLLYDCSSCYLGVVQYCAKYWSVVQFKIECFVLFLSCESKKHTRN